MPSLTELPLELVEHILSCADPIVVARVAQTCRLYRSLVYESQDQHLWRALFLSDLELFDDPRKCQTLLGDQLVAADADFDWRGELQRRVRAEAVIAKPDRCKDGELTEVLTTLVSMANNTPPASTAYAPHEISHNLVWLAAQRPLGAFIEHWHARRQALAPEQRQRLAQLHTLFGLTSVDFSPARLVESRAFVYDLRNYSEETSWGPFKTDGSVNWEHVRAAQHIMAKHVVVSSKDTDGYTACLLPYCQAQVSGRWVSGGGFNDWAGVEGAWTCSFCFIDHRELSAFNAQELADGEPRDTSLFEALDFLEIFRSFTIHMRITGTRENSRHPTKPDIRFQGNLHDVRSVAGIVSVADDDTVRWRFTSGEDAELIWSSEGVQIGATQSTFGVLGTWTTIFHDQEDPVGPFWLRKEFIYGVEKDFL